MNIFNVKKNYVIILSLTRIMWLSLDNTSMIRFILYNASIIRLAPTFQIGNEKHTFRMISIHNTHPHLLSSKT